MRGKKPWEQEEMVREGLEARTEKRKRWSMLYLEEGCQKYDFVFVIPLEEEHNACFMAAG